MFESLDELTNAMLECVETRIKSHAPDALNHAATHVLFAFDPTSPFVTGGELGAELAEKLGTDPVVESLPLETAASIVASFAGALDLMGDGKGTELRRRFEAPLEPHTFRLLTLCGQSIGLAIVPRTWAHPIAGSVGGAAIARAALPALLQLNNANAAIITDDCTAARSLRSKLHLSGPGPVHAVDRERLADVMEASEYALTFEASDLACEVPQDALAILVLHETGTWTGYLLQEQLHQIDDVAGETETQEAHTKRYLRSLD